MDEAKCILLALTTTGKTLATAESCTGGLLGKLLTDVPGASNAYLGGVISYAYSVKKALLGVDARLLREKGAVCEEAALQMAQGVRQRLKADYGVSVTGNAGPSADPKNQNVGEIYVACADSSRSLCERLTLHGSREENRFAACKAALLLLLRMHEENTEKA